MSTIMPGSELVRRALVFLAEERCRSPQKSASALLDEAGMRFNLSPAEAAALERCFRASAGERNARP